MEICGECVLIKKVYLENNSFEDKLPVTSNYLIQRLGQRQQFLEEEKGLPWRKPTGIGDKSLNSKIRLLLQTDLNKIKETFEPALSIHSITTVDQPKELIACNLNLRRIEKKIHENQLKNQLKKK